MTVIAHKALLGVMFALVSSITPPEEVAAQITQTKSVDERICPSDRLITVARCNFGTMISCESIDSKVTFTCDGFGYPTRAIIEPAEQPSTVVAPTAAAKALTPLPALAPAPAKVYIYHREHDREPVQISHHHRFTRHHASMPFDVFLKSIFVGGSHGMNGHK